MSCSSWHKTTNQCGRNASFPRSYLDLSLCRALNAFSIETMWHKLKHFLPELLRCFNKQIQIIKYLAACVQPTRLMYVSEYNIIMSVWAEPDPRQFCHVSTCCIRWCIDCTAFLQWLQLNIPDDFHMECWGTEQKDWNKVSKFFEHKVVIIIMVCNWYNALTWCCTRNWSTIPICDVTCSSE